MKHELDDPKTCGCARVIRWFSQVFPEVTVTIHDDTCTHCYPSEDPKAVTHDHHKSSGRQFVVVEIPAGEGWGPLRAINMALEVKSGGTVL